MSRRRFSTFIYYSPRLYSLVANSYRKRQTTQLNHQARERIYMKADTAKAEMTKQMEKIETFRELHVPGNPIILYNIWDAGSAQAVAKSQRAIATSSWAVAKAHGSKDGEHFPYDLAIRNLREIVDAVELPVTFDLESGYGEEPDKVGESISLAIQAGAVGCNFEDSVPDNGTIRDIATQAARIRGARRASEAAGVPFFINARCDLFFRGLL
jgi:2-methylisocitrate lyase-like PEP mutase family enzyme